ncbi:hypothetical protein LZC95_13465 [Pendulispora brunnea]|uniref:Lipoprotein n=1 Tax=Pendulispora brunnea TaxID=2905690 RepID=A0ABZ2KKK3_9BACT
MKSMVMLSCLCLALGTGCASSEETSAPSHQPVEDATVWTPTSASLELHSVRFLERPNLESKLNRSDLTSVQLEALAKLRIIETPTSGPVPDAGSYLLRVVDEDGSVRDYLAAGSNDVPEVKFGVTNYRTIDIESLAPFVATLE